LKRIGMFAPWKVRCGVAEYSGFLSGALAGLGHEVYVIPLNRFGQKDDQYYSWYATQVPAEEKEGSYVESPPMDMLHVQHEPGLYGMGQEANFYGHLRDYYRSVLRAEIPPVVTTVHGAGISFRSDDMIAQYSDAVIAHNAAQARAFRHPCVTIPMGCMPVASLPDPVDAKKRYGVEGRTVGVFGFLTEYKDIRGVVDAVSELEDVALLVGGGWHVELETGHIRDLRAYAAQKLSGRVYFLGYLEDEALPSFFSACDVLVFSHRWISGSMSLAMAMSHARPILTSDLPPFREEEERGALVTFKDVGDLASKLDALLGDDEVREALGARAYARAEECSWTRIAEATTKLYEGLLEARKKGERE